MELEAEAPAAAAPPASFAGFSLGEKRYIAAAVSLLVVFMVGTAFAAGVYIGNNRELAPGTAPGVFGGPPPGGAPQGPNAGGQAGPQRFGQPPQQGVPGAQQPPGANPGTGGTAYDIVGALASRGDASLTVATADGPRQVATDASTRYIRDDGQPATTDAYRQGAVVGVRLRPGSSVAEAVILITGRGNTRP